MTVRLSHRCSRAVVAGALAATGIAFAAPHAAASTISSHATTITCGPKSISHQAAPGKGHHITEAAASSGSVTLRQQSLTTLRVSSVTRASGWKDTVIAANGTRVHVGFQQVGMPQNQERFWARLDSTGTILTVVVQSCS